MSALPADLRLIADPDARYVPAPGAHLAIVLVIVALIAGGWLTGLLGWPDWTGLCSLALAAFATLIGWPIDRYFYERRIVAALGRTTGVAPAAARLERTELPRQGKAELLVVGEVRVDGLTLSVERRRIGRRFVYHLVGRADGAETFAALGASGVTRLPDAVATLRSGRSA
jgi:hypothetical protein